MVQIPNNERVFYVPIPEEEYFERIAEAVCRKLQNYKFPDGRQANLQWLTHGEAAAYLKKTPAALYKLSSERKVKYSKRGKQNYYRPEDLDVYMRDGLVATKNEVIKDIRLIPKRKI